MFDRDRPLDLENANPGNQDVLVMRDDKEGEETFPEPDSDGSDSDDEDDDDDEEAGGMSPRTRRLQRAESSASAPRITLAAHSTDGRLV